MECPQLYNSRPAITYRRGVSLRNSLCPSYVISSVSGETWLPPQPKGSFTCGTCNVCPWGRNKTKTFSYNSPKKYTIGHFINCNTTYVVYVLGCKCGIVYVGSTIHCLKHRIQEHRRALRNRDDRYPMRDHYYREHPDDVTFWFHGIDHVPMSKRGGNRELLLRQTEAKWICRFRATCLGHNTDDEMHCFLWANQHINQAARQNVTS